MCEKRGIFLKSKKLFPIGNGTIIALRFFEKMHLPDDPGLTYTKVIYYRSSSKYKQHN